MNIKAELIERERVAYINNDPKLAAFFDATLEYILLLEQQVNSKDAELETVITATKESIAATLEAQHTWISNVAAARLARGE